MPINVQPQAQVLDADHSYDDYCRFKHVVRCVIASLREKRSALVEPDQLEITIIRITEALFKLSDRGVRDPILLQQAAEARILAQAGPAEWHRRASTTLH